MPGKAESSQISAIPPLPPLGIVICDASGQVISWSSGAESLLGWTCSDALGSAIARFLPALGSCEVREDTLDANGVHKSGQTVPLVIRRTPFAAADAVGCGAVLVIESRIASSETSDTQPGEQNGWDAQRHRLVLEAARLGDWSWNARTDVVTLSKRAAEIFDVAPGAHLTWAELRGLLHPDDRERARLAVERAIAERSDYALEYRLGSGTRERWVSAAGRGRFDHGGRIVEMYGVLQDITGHRLLVRVDDSVRPLVNPEEITYTAARLLGEHLGVNRCAYAFVEEDEDTFTLTGNYTNGLDSIVGRYRFRQFGAECLRLMRAGEPYVVEDSDLDHRLDADDRRAYIQTRIRGVICVPILKSGRFVAAMAVHSGAPRRWFAAEIELLQQVASRCWESIERARVERERSSLLEAAEAASRAKDEFLAMLGHELRNPLAPIVTALQVMSLRDDKSSGRERTIIERQVTHLTRLVDDLLDVARIARGKVELKSDIVEVADIVNKALEVASPLLEQRAHQVALQIPRSGLTVNGDPGRLTQVLANLLTNAAKYTPPNGRITITGAIEADTVRLVVRDTGMGMTPDVLRHAFEMFVQGRQALDRAEGGLGLGLTIVKNLVERHGGSVAAHSDGPGQGSTFVIQLPHAQLRPTATTPEKAGEGRHPSVNGARVLIVDDNEDAAEMLGMALKLRGCNVSLAHDGPDALRLAAAEAFDIAFLDIGLPAMDGYELAARLQALPTGEQTRLVAVTGYGQDEDRRRAFAAGFHEHLVKPVELRQVYAVIAKLAPRLPRQEH